MRMLLAMVVELNLELEEMDVKTTFLYVDFRRNHLNEVSRRI